MAGLARPTIRLSRGDFEAVCSRGPRNADSVIAIRVVRPINALVAAVALATCYSQGSGVQANPTQYAAWLLEAARRGDAPCMRRVGELYETGRCLPVDIPKSVAWLRRAVEAHDAPARERLVQLLDEHPELRQPGDP